MVTTTTATELARHLSGILNRARYEDERFIIKRNGEAVAILEPIVPQSVSLRQIAAQLARIPRADFGSQTTLNWP